MKGILCHAYYEVGLCEKMEIIADSIINNRTIAELREEEKKSGTYSLFTHNGEYMAFLCRMHSNYKKDLPSKVLEDYSQLEYLAYESDYELWKTVIFPELFSYIEKIKNPQNG